MNTNGLMIVVVKLERKLSVMQNCLLKNSSKVRQSFLSLRKKASLKCGYIPTNAKVINGTVNEQAGRYYVSIVCEVEETKNNKPKTEPIGIDLGLKDFAVMSNELVKKNINKTSRVDKLEKKLYNVHIGLDTNSE